MPDRALRIIATLALGLCGAAAGVALGIPAGALIGSSVLVAGLAAAGAPMMVPAPIRNLGFAVIGLSLGAGVTPDSFQRIGSWSLSLAILAVSIAATMLAVAAVLRRVYTLDPETALLSATPGTMSYVLAIAADGRGDAPTVLVLQVLRLLMLATILPILVVSVAAAPVLPPPAHVMAWSQLAGVLALVAMLGWLGARAGLPAAWLVAGMVVNGAAHAVGTVQGAAPAWMLFAGFAVTGAVLGARFTGLSLAVLRRLIVASVATVLLATAIAAAFAEVTHLVTGLPFGQTWIAYAPGGVEAMAAVGLALGYDPAFIAIHHLVRIGFLIAFLPVALRWNRTG